MNRFRRAPFVQQGIASALIAMQFMGLFVPRVTYAQTSSSTLSGSTIPTSLPQQFSAAPAVSMGGLGGCTSPIQSALSQVGSLFSASGAAGAALDASGCPMPVAVTVPSSCATMTETLRATLERNAGINVAAYSCKKAKLDSISQALSCVSTAAGQINTQIGALQSHFASMYQNGTQISNAFKTLIDEKTKKLQNVDERMEEIEQAESETNQLLTQIDTQITQARASVDRLRLQRSELDRARELMPAAHAQECFREKVVSSYRCSTSARASAEERASQTPLNAMLCMYEQRLQTVSSGGQTRTSTGVSAANDAQSARTQLQSALESALSQMPNQTTLPTSQEGVSSSLAQPSAISSLEQINAYADANLAGLPAANGFNPAEVFKSMMSYCFRVGQQLTRAQEQTGDIKRAQEGVDALEGEVRAGLSTQLAAFTRRYEENSSAMTTQYSPFNRSACENAKPAQTVSCLQGMKTALDAQLRGGSGEADQVLFIGGATGGGVTDPDNIACRGLSGCKRQLLNKRRELNDLVGENGRLLRDRESFVSSFNSQMTAQSSAVLAQNPQLSVMNQSLQSQLNALNTQLGALGVSPGISIRTVEGSGRLEPDENGLMQPPENVLEFVGSQMSPKLMDLSGDFLSEGMSGVADKAREVEEKLAEAQGKIGEVGARMASCREESAKAAVTNAKQAVSHLENCQFYERAYCGASDDRFHDLVADIGRLSGNGVSAEDVERLRSGVEQGCVATPETQATGTSRTTTEASQIRRCNSVFQEVETAVGGLRSAGGAGGGSSAGSAQ